MVSVYLAEDLKHDRKVAPARLYVSRSSATGCRALHSASRVTKARSPRWGTHPPYDRALHRMGRANSL